MKRWKSILGVLLVFLLGALAGAAVYHRIGHQRVEAVLSGGRRHGGPRRQAAFPVAGPRPRPTGPGARHRHRDAPGHRRDPEAGPGPGRGGVRTLPRPHSRDPASRPAGEVRPHPGRAPEAEGAAGAVRSLIRTASPPHDCVAGGNTPRGTRSPRPPSNERLLEPSLPIAKTPWP